MALITIAEAKFPNWTGSGSIKLFIAPDKSFVVDGEEVQGGNLRDPDEKASWIITVPCTVSTEDGVRTLTVPEIELHSTTDSDDPTAKYQQKLTSNQTKASSVALLGLRTFRLPASPTSTTWQAIRTYNLAAQELTPADNLNALLSAAVAEEAAIREAADEALQGQIDGIGGGSVFKATISEDTAFDDFDDAQLALILIDTTESDVTATFPPAATIADCLVVCFKTADENMAILDGHASEMFVGSPLHAPSQVFNLETLYQSARVMAEGSTLYLV